MMYGDVCINMHREVWMMLLHFIGIVDPYGQQSEQSDIEVYWRQQIRVTAATAKITMATSATASMGAIDITDNRIHIDGGFCEIIETE